MFLNLLYNSNTFIMALWTMFESVMSFYLKGITTKRLMRIEKTAGNTQESFMITYIQTKYFLIQTIVNSERVPLLC